MNSKYDIANTERLIGVRFIDSNNSYCVECNDKLKPKKNYFIFVYNNKHGICGVVCNKCMNKMIHYRDRENEKGQL